MREENRARYAIIRKAYNDMNQIGDTNLLKIATYIDQLKDKEEQMRKTIDLGLEMGE
ncbi:hypothetical protein [Metabacillus fastidiosus]|uniref:hypothetical protein n=1 Tax=Metabacillus fastidiosus TaxID=1458 RepID=UPI003D2DE397